MHHNQSWWNHRHLGSVLLVHYADLKADPAGEIRCIADFLAIEISDDALG
ncbi:MAG: sulfotransferase domain-containing protein [Caldilineaceae bacterium]|nr:sulfotransferase domain-containing protein [Caldilineaceae bacterium]